MTYGKRNARFWVWWNDGWVKLTVGPHHTITHSRFSHTDEGWARDDVSYEHDGDVVICRTVDDGVDCDGRLTRCATFSCLLEDLSAVPPPPADEQVPGEFWPRRPLWTKHNSHQRDYAAEQAGY